jgi:hypothetical protein
MRVREKTLEKRNLEAKNPTKNEKISESLTSMSSTMVDEQLDVDGEGEKTEKPPSSIPSKTSQFFRRFRLSAKTRSKYRSELRRSNSLLDLRSTNSDQSDIVEHQVEKSLAISSLEWLRRRKQRCDAELSQKLEEMYVGNTLLKQKPRLRVRNANLTTVDPAHHSQSQFSPRNANSLPTNPPVDFDLERVPSTEQQRSDMEQVLYRAARLRRRRDRSKSNETTNQTNRRSKSENHQASERKFSPLPFISKSPPPKSAEF